MKKTNGITGPSNGVPNLLSYGEFLSASLSCTFRKYRRIPPLLTKEFLKDPTEPAVQRYLVCPCELRVGQFRWFRIGMGLTCRDSDTTLQKRE